MMHTFESSKPVKSVKLHVKMDHNLAKCKDLRHQTKTWDVSLRPIGPISQERSCFGQQTSSVAKSPSSNASDDDLQKP